MLCSAMTSLRVACQTAPVVFCAGHVGGRPGDWCLRGAGEGMKLNGKFVGKVWMDPEISESDD
jgi:hypothetical protein